MYNIYIIRLTNKLADISSDGRRYIIDARPSPPHFVVIVSIFIHVYFLVKPLESIF